MKKLIAVLSMTMVAMLMSATVAFAAPSPAPTPTPGKSDAITGKATNHAGVPVTVTVTPDPNNPATTSMPSTITVNPDGTFTIPSVEFTEPGTYTFTLTDGAGNTYTLTYVVEKDPETGELKVTSVTMRDANGNVISANDMVFGKAKGSTGGTTGKKAGSSSSGSTGKASGTTGSKAAGTAKTGDFMATHWQAAVVAVIAAAAAGYFFKRSRRAQD